MEQRRGPIRKLVSAARAAVRRPDLVRNRILGALNYWPVTRLRNERLRKVPYFCINLEKDVQRRKLAERQARTMGLEDFRIFKGIVGVKLDIDQLIADGIYDDAAARRYHGRPLSPAEIGLSLSHANIYKTIVEEGLDEAVILEDDVLFQPRNLDAVDWSAIPDDFDVVFLHAQLDQKPPRGRIADRIYSDESYLASTVAYLVSRKGAEKLAKGAFPVVHAADGLVGRAMPWHGDTPHEFRQQGVNFDLKSYILYPEGALNGSTCHFIGSSISF
ncbi:glycosyltransferase family 25 protein [Sinisalibacter aestuarii]|uniref:Glycosyl transferase family 25 domain-containing protein n=1 Tax=Sinisalibacter aestuarii TaxID=2949426 RepID=A0ABQ5LVL1_9RHOB|nr:glycosyltransferase family 25 protein [Sinisalibacter aestuarii]GKY88147.1 hypothetical protein STA1M1_20160 [Sinisalibacter aestuarii]